MVHILSFKILSFCDFSDDIDSDFWKLFDKSLITSKIRACSETLADEILFQLKFPKVRSWRRNLLVEVHEPLSSIHHFAFKNLKNEIRLIKNIDTTTYETILYRM